MYLLLADETNKDETPSAKFFIYGGLIVPLNKLSELNQEINKIRSQAGYRPGDEFKFNTRARPSHVSREEATEAKRNLINLCKKAKCRFVVQVTLHALMSTCNPDDQLMFAVNTVLGAFNKFLKERGSYGLCLVDNLSIRTQWRYLAEKFTRGLTFPDRSDKPLERILIYGATCINAGHANSAMDIVLGTFRYCINRPQNEKVASEMLKSVMPLMLSKEIGGHSRITDHGLLLRPQRVNSQSYKKDYEELVTWLNALAEDVT